jgi:UDPglucose 6-dehydrogenase
VQLLANYSDVPPNLIHAIIAANRAHRDFIADGILRRNPRVVGIYRLSEESGSDIRAASAVTDIIKRLKTSGAEVIIYEPALAEPEFLGCPVIRDLAAFKRHADVILANRRDATLADVPDKIFTRDIARR